MPLRHVAALVTSICAENASANRVCEERDCFEAFVDTSSMLMRTEMEVADDANLEPLSQDNISALLLSSNPHDISHSEEKDRPEERGGSETMLVEVSHEEDRSESGAAFSTAAAQAAKSAEHDTILSSDPGDVSLSEEEDTAEEKAGSATVLVDVSHGGNRSKSGATSSAAASRATEIAEHNRTWTESFAEVLHKAVHFHEVSEKSHVLPTPDNFTVSSLKQNAEELLIEGIIEAIGVFLFIVIMCGCVCFCTIREAQASARATAYNADIRDTRDTGRFTTCARGTTVSKQSGLKDYKDDADVVDDDDEETDEPADANENEKFEKDALTYKVAKEKEAKIIKE